MRMKKKEIEKIEEKLSDVAVSDGVLDLARAEIAQGKRYTTRKINFRTVLACAASFALCLAFVLPVALSSRINNDFGCDDFVSDDGDTSTPNFIYLSDLEKWVIEQSPWETEAVKYKSHIKYFLENEAIISEERYSVYGSQCTVYTLYNDGYVVDVLKDFKNYPDEYSLDSVTVKYKTYAKGFIAEAYYGDYRRCFILENSEKNGVRRILRIFI